MRYRLAQALFTAALLMIVCAGARAETFTAYLTGAQEVGPTGSTATGYARVIVNESTGQLTFTVVFNGLSSTQTASHIHAPAAIGATAAVAINFGVVGGTSGTVTGTTTITPTQLAQIRQHLGYVNVHSTNFPNGEIRGQLGPSRPVDYDGDGRTDFSVLRFPSANPAPITWWNSNSTSGTQVVSPFGNANTDFPTPGDYDGDGKGDIALYRSGANAGDPNTFFVLRSSDSTALAIGFGLNGDQPVCRDFDGDGITDVAIFRRGATIGSQAVWWIRRSTSPSSFLVVPFGLTGDGVAGTGDEPVPGDYDGDGKFDIAVYRHGIASPDNSFIVLRSSDSAVEYQQWGNFNSDYVVPGDYDGDGKCDFAVARTGPLSTSPIVWWILQSSTGTLQTATWGKSTDFPAQGDYDGDARTDIAIYRAGATSTAQSTYWVLNSFDNSPTVVNWGVGADFSVNKFDIR